MSSRITDRRIIGVAIAAMAVFACAKAPPTLPAGAIDEPVQLIPSEDSQIPNLHSLGLINGTANIFRSGSPVSDLLKKAATQPSDQAPDAVITARMQHLRDLGIRTIVSFEAPDAPAGEDVTEKQEAIHRAVTTEAAAAKEAGIAFIDLPMRNSGKESMQTMTDAEVAAALKEASDTIIASSGTGGVLFHCSAGKDRTGMVGAYLRIKYQHWPVDQAIAEMRRYGHMWTRFLAEPTATSSWHEDHLRAIAPTIDSTPR